MKLTTKQIESIAQGAVRVDENEGRTKFHRFTAEQEKLYADIGNMDFYNKTFATAGVRLKFKTDSRLLFLKVKTSGLDNRRFFSHDIVVDGIRIDSLANFSKIPTSEEYLSESFPLGEFSKIFDLGNGIKEVSILFPFSVISEIIELSIDDGTQIMPVKEDKKMIFFGDSITQGYDTFHPENHHTTRVAEAFGAELINKGIGGAIFLPALAERRDSVTPDYIVVAYGTNDWGQRTAEQFSENCRAFYSALVNNYPNSKIFALTPIWRTECEERRMLGAFSDTEKIIHSVTENMENVICISGLDFVPKEPKYFTDLRLHPSDEGCAYYAESLIKAMKAYI